MLNSILSMKGRLPLNLMTRKVFYMQVLEAGVFIGVLSNRG